MSALGRSVVAVWLSCLFFSCPSAAPAVTCDAPLTACSNGCADLKVDSQNCGSCGAACAAGTACANAACLPQACSTGPCEPDQVCADERCADRSCVGVLCPQGQQCARGACTCGGGRLECSGTCTDVRLDDASCGACGKACPAGQHCAAGTCVNEDCAAQDCDPLSVCVDDRCAERACVGVACPAGRVCHAGACGCAAGEQICGSDCADTQHSEQHCGQCGHACAMGERCSAGQCFPASCSSTTCDPLSVCVNDQCVESACVGVACPPGQSCSSGVCQCAAGQRECGGACVSVTDNQNCGTCGRACPSGTRCGGGECLPDSCGAMSCDPLSVCVQGACAERACVGVACQNGGTCQNGQCICPAGQTSCGGRCTDVRTDAANCGMCGRVCTGVACANSTCQCSTDQLLCSGECKSVRIDAMNCGTCGNVCTGGRVCTNSMCVCPAGQSFCNGTCIDNQRDNLNCGGCNMPCAGNLFCSGGMCRPPFTCQTNFNMAPPGCTLTPIDPNMCGVDSFVSATPFMGTHTPNVPSDLPFTLQPNERMIAIGTIGAFLTASNFDFTNTAGQSLYGGYCGNGCGSVNAPITGTPMQCAHPIRLRITSGEAIQYNLSVEKHHLSGKFNTGSIDPTAATPLAVNATTQRACDQVCGEARNYCGDDLQYYRLTLPAGKAAIVEVMFKAAAPSASSRVTLQVLEGNGTGACTLVPQAYVTPMGTVFRARLVNNTNASRVAVITPDLQGQVNEAASWNMVVAEEP